MIIFGTNISDTICRQMTIQFPENTTNEILLFYPMRYDCL